MSARPRAELWKSVAAERRIDLPAAHLHRIIADFNEHHPKFLPPALQNEFRLSPGFRGVIEGLIAPPVLRRLLAGELARLEAYSRTVPV